MLVYIVITQSFFIHVSMGISLFRCYINKCKYYIVSYHDKFIKKYINLLRALKTAVKKALGYYDLFTAKKKN